MILRPLRHHANESNLLLAVCRAMLLAGCGVLALAAGRVVRGQEGTDDRPVPPWPPQYKAGGTAADVLGPDGQTWFPNWTAVGVQGGIPDIKPFAPIEQYGGRADDDADDGQALQEACNAAGRAGGGAVLLGEGTYYLDRKVRITDNGVVIRGKGRDKTKIVIRYKGGENRITDGIITFAGGSGGPQRPLAADAKRGDTGLSVEDAAGLAKGDWIMLEARGTQRWRSLVDSRCRLTPRMAMVRIEQVRGNTLTINQPLRLDFPLIDQSYVYKVAPIEGCGIEDLYLTQVPERPKICTVLFIRGVNCWGRRVTVEWTGRMPLYGSHVKWTEIRDCEFKFSHDMGGGGTAYVGWQYSFDCLMDNVVTHKMRHAPNVDWACSGNVFRNCTFYYSDAQTHSGWCNENLFENCVIVDPKGRPTGGGSYGHGFWATPPSDRSHGPNGPRNVFYNCDIQNAGEGPVFGDDDQKGDMQRYGPTGVVLGGMNENWLFFYNRILSRGPAILLRGVQFDHVIKGNVFVVEGDWPAVVVEAPERSSGLELADNLVCGGNGAPVSASGSALAMLRENHVEWRGRTLPPRPQPEVPSIYEWQQKTLKR